jgi:hypothetical protein
MKSTKTQCPTDGKTSPKEIIDATGGLISLNTARIWLKGERKRSKAADAILLLVSKLKQCANRQPIEAQKPEIQPVKEITLREEIEAALCNRKIELSSSRYKVEGDKIYFKGSKGVYLAPFSQEARYFLTFEGQQYALTFDPEKLAGKFESKLLTNNDLQ